MENRKKEKNKMNILTVAPRKRREGRNIIREGWERRNRRKRRARRKRRTRIKRRIRRIYPSYHHKRQDEKRRYKTVALEREG